MQSPRSHEELPQTVPVFPLSGALLLPNTHRPLNIFEPRYVALVDRALATDRLVGLVQPLDTRVESPRGHVPLQSVGCLGRITHFEEQDDERYFIILEGVSRFDILDEVETPDPFRICRVSAARFARDFDHEYGSTEVDRKRFLAMMHSYADFAQLDIDWSEVERTDTADLVNFCCVVSPYGAAEKQALLEAMTLNERAETLIAMAEIEMARSRPGSTLQ